MPEPLSAVAPTYAGAGLVPHWGSGHCQLKL